MTLQELYVLWQAKVIYDWHHTAHIIQVTAGDSKTPYGKLHPYIRDDYGQRQRANVPRGTKGSFKR